MPGRGRKRGREPQPALAEGNRQMRRILNQAANAAVKHKGSIFEIVYRRLIPRLGHNKTIGVIAHRLCHLICDAVDFVAASKGALTRVVEHAILVPELVEGGAAARVIFAKYVAQIPK